MKKPLKLDEKIRKKTGREISMDEKPLKLDEETRKKTDYLLLLQGVNNFQNLVRKTERKPNTDQR